MLALVCVRVRVWIRVCLQVDEMYSPMPHPLVDGEHVILYDPHDGRAFAAKLRCRSVEFSCPCLRLSFSQLRLFSTSSLNYSGTLSDRYYLEHPSEAREIARRGYLHTLQYHRAVSRVDFFLRSAHAEELRGDAEPSPRAGAALTAATETSVAYEHTGRSIAGNYSHAASLGPAPPLWAR